MREYYCTAMSPDGRVDFVKNDRKQAVEAVKAIAEQSYGTVEFTHGTIIDEEYGDVWEVAASELTGKAMVIKRY